MCFSSFNRECSDALEARSKTILYFNEATTNRTTNGTVETVNNPADLHLDIGIDGVVGTRSVQSSDLSILEMVGKIEVLPASLPLDSTAYEPSGLNNSNQMQKTKWPEKSDELLGLIINSLKKIDGAVPKGCPEPKQRPQSAHEIALILERAPIHVHWDLIALVLKLVDYSKHSLAAYALLYCL
ncbi:hypothetical protein SUGI_1046210 [Cryptomeria japonica]|nr:hypothetical protein SUGI_1046210 [Cryptomeria japonica]